MPIDYENIAKKYGGTKKAVVPTSKETPTQEKPTGIVQSIAQGLVSPFAKTASTALSAGRGVYNLAKAAAMPGKITENPEAMRLVGEAGKPVNLDLNFFGQYKPVENLKEAIGVGLELGSYATGLRAAGIKGVTGKAIGTRIAAGGLIGAEQGAGSAMSVGKGAKDIAKSTAIGAGVGLATAGIFEGMGALWRKTLGKTEFVKETAGDIYNKELQPPIKDIEKDVRRGFEDVGRQMSEVVDDKGNPVYVAKITGVQGKNKAYRSLLNIADKEIKQNSSVLRKTLNQYDDIVTRKELAGDIIKQMENEYGQLTPSQIKQINFEISRMPKAMNLNEVLDTKQMYDDLIPETFWSKIDDPAQSFPSIVKYKLRDNARKIINGKTADKTIQQLNNETSLAFDIKKLAAHQIAIRKTFKIASTGRTWSIGIGRKIGQIIDDTIGNPALTTKYAQAIKGVTTGQSKLGQFGRAFITRAGQELKKQPLPPQK